MLQRDQGSLDVKSPPPAAFSNPDALASLRGEAVGRRYCAWRGASDRRYVASIYAADPAAPDLGLPAFDGCILMAVARRGNGRRVLSVTAIERARDTLAPIAGARAGVEAGDVDEWQVDEWQVDEWHVHLLAESAQGRRTAVADLARRHLPASQ